MTNLTRDEQHLSTTCFQEHAVNAAGVPILTAVVFQPVTLLPTPAPPLPPAIPSVLTTGVPDPPLTPATLPHPQADSLAWCGAVVLQAGSTDIERLSVNHNTVFTSMWVMQAGVSRSGGSFGVNSALLELDQEADDR